MKEPNGSSDRDPGVPEAIPRGLQFLWAQLGPATLDRVWIFPPLVSGRSERGLLAVSRYVTGDDPDRRILLTLPYSAERSGSGLGLERGLEEQGEAPLDRFPRVMQGVVQRADSDLGDPREVVVEGSEERLRACLAEFDAALLDPELPPLRVEREAPAAHGEPDPGAGSGAGGVLDELPPHPPADGTRDDDMYDLYAAGSAS